MQLENTTEEISNTGTEKTGEQAGVSSTISADLFKVLWQFEEQGKQTCREIFLTAVRNWSPYATEIQSSLGTSDPLSRHLYALSGRKRAAWSSHVVEAQLTVQPVLGPCPDSSRKVLKRPFFSSTGFCVDHRN